MFRFASFLLFFRYRHRFSQMACCAGLAAFMVLGLSDLSFAQQIQDEQLGEGPKDGEFDPVIAIVNGIGIRRSEIIETARFLPAQYADLPFEMVYPMLVDRLIDIKLLADEGKKADLSNNERVRRRVFEATERIIQEVYLTNFVEERINKRGLQRRYADFLKKNATQEEILFRQIRLGTEQRAAAVIVELNNGKDFADLAAEWSNDPEGQKGGVMGWRSQQEISQIFGIDYGKKLFSLPIGIVSPQPVQTDFGWHVLRVDEQRSLPAPSFEEMKSNLVAVWSQEIITDLIKKLRKAAHIERFDVALPTNTVGGAELRGGIGLSFDGGFAVESGDK